jgi:hypothetical protein
VRKALVLAVVAGAFWLAPGALASTWCGGTAESPADRTDIVTGRQIHTVVAIPAGAPDTFATTATQLQTDVDSANAWWVGQDPTRRPRFDLANFGGTTTCLDISFMRLKEAGFASADEAFRTITDELAADGFDDTYKKDLVYYSGPSVETDVCGVGGGDVDGPGVAIVIPAGCPTVPSDSVLAHELLHALGAVPPGDPHACPNDSGHPCDSPTDVLYPTTHGEPLSQKVLDYNHDDYYAHSGTWPDIQDSLWLSHLDQPQLAFTVALVGSGAVSSDVPGIACVATCTTQWDTDSVFTITASPAAGERFVGWRGACAGLGDCVVMLGAPQTATAVFGPARIPVKVAVKGKGRIACTPRCSPSFRAGTLLTLRAVPAKGWRFVRWSGACKGTRGVCRPKTDYALAVRATFAKKPASR